MTEERKPLENTEGIFVGSELLGTGEKDGKEWKRYKAKFKPSMESEKQFTFTCFSALKAKGTKQLSDLEDGKKYRICYASEERTHAVSGESYTSKTIIGFYSPNGKSIQNGVEGSFKPKLGNFDAFRKEYLEKVKANNMKPNVVHMLGSYIATTEKERVAELLAKCQETVTVKKEISPEV